MGEPDQSRTLRPGHESQQSRGSRPDEEEAAEGEGLMADADVEIIGRPVQIVYVTRELLADGPVLSVILRRELDDAERDQVELVLRRTPDA